MAFYIEFLREPTRGVLAAAANRLSEPALSITDNAVHRTATRWPTLQSALTTLGLTDPAKAPRIHLGTGVRPSRAAQLSSESRALLEWSKKAKLPKHAGATITEGSASLKPSSVEERATGRSDVPVVTYDGFRGAVAKDSAHSLDALHAMVVRALDVVEDAWEWSPTGLTVQFHRGRRAMGLAFSPGKGHRLISLAVELLARYDIDSVYRTTLHELAHHAREELHQRPRTKYADMHDAKFCEMLGLVDEDVRGKGQQKCQFFNDEIDLSVVAAVAEANGVVYSPGAGELIIGHGSGRTLRFRWDATGTARWRSTWQSLRNVGSLCALLRQFPVADRGRIPSRYEPSAKGVYFHAMMPDDVRRARPVQMLSGELIRRFATVYRGEARSMLEGALVS